MKCIDIETLEVAWATKVWGLGRIIQFSPDGTRLLVNHLGKEFGSISEAVQELFTETGEVASTIYSADTTSIQDARYNRDGSLILIVPSSRYNYVEIADVATSRSYKFAKYVLTTPDSLYVMRGEFSSDGRYVAIAGQEGFGICEVPELSDVGVTGEVAATELLPIAPNPTRGLVTIPFHVGERSHVRLSVYNALGMEVEALEEGEYETGKHVVWYQSEELRSGQYYIVLRAGDQSWYQPLQVIR